MQPFCTYRENYIYVKNPIIISITRELVASDEFSEIKGVIADAQFVYFRFYIA